MNSGEYTVKKCKNRAAFLFQPKNKQSKNLEKLAEKLKKREKIKALTPLLLVAKVKGVNATIYKNGKILIKTNSKQKAKNTLKKINPIINPKE